MTKKTPERGSKIISDPAIIEQAIELGMYEALKKVEAEQNITIIGAIVRGVDKELNITIEAFYEENPDLIPPGYKEYIVNVGPQTVKEEREPMKQITKVIILAVGYCVMFAGVFLNSLPVFIAGTAFLLSIGAYLVFKRGGLI